MLPNICLINISLYLKNTLLKMKRFDIERKIASDYRMDKIVEIQKELMEERAKRLSLANKYQRGVNALTGISTSLNFVSVGLGVAGVSVYQLLSPHQ